jgi:hypothetical protein
VISEHQLPRQAFEWSPVWRWRICGLSRVNSEDKKEPVCPKYITEAIRDILSRTGFCPVADVAELSGSAIRAPVY